VKERTGESRGPAKWRRFKRVFPRDFAAKIWTLRAETRIQQEAKESSLARSRFKLEREQVVPRPRGEVFDFFSRAENLEILTPGFLHFEILTPLPIRMAPGTIIDYRIKLFGVPQKWKTLIEVHEPERRFVDSQARGPYAFWRHVHEFDDVPGGTRIRDAVDYELPFGPLGVLTHALFVGRTLRRIFDFRREKIAELFGAPGSEHGS
jgi:ligand-binding SRPBCC domain-containing protein